MNVTSQGTTHFLSITDNPSFMLRLLRNWLSICSRFTTKTTWNDWEWSGGMSEKYSSHSPLRRFETISAMLLAFISRSSVRNLPPPKIVNRIVNWILFLDFPLEFYTYALIVPTVLGFLQFIFGGERTLFFCCFYVVWMTVFLETWKRKCSKKAYNWGTLSLANMEIARPDYYGTYSVK